MVEPNDPPAPAMTVDELLAAYQRTTKDRLQVRRIDYAGGVAGLALGGLLTPAMLHGDPSRLLGTFLGLVSASILPSISLILASMTTGGRSVAAIDRLRDELQTATDALLGLLVLVAIVFGAVLMLSVSPPAMFDRAPLLENSLGRAGQAIVVGGSIVIVLRAVMVPKILKRCLSIRHEIAADEAKKKTIENASKVGEAGKIFPRDPAFGRTVTLADVRES